MGLAQVTDIDVIAIVDELREQGFDWVADLIVSTISSNGDSLSEPDQFETTCKVLQDVFVDSFRYWESQQKILGKLVVNSPEQNIDFSYVLSEDGEEKLFNNDYKKISKSMSRLLHSLLQERR